MDKIKCKNCSEYQRCKDDKISFFFFIIGLIATIAIRIVNLLMDINPISGKISWYIGVIGFLLFFLYKYKIDKSRAEFILKNKLQEKIINSTQLSFSDEDKKILSAILCSLSSNKDRINYFVIFLSSLIALILSVYFDFLR
ncbi:MAG TPA: hypothetical protein PLD27_12220 [bacterium]|nr:hypothetical protein [bacterium]HOL48533.1 hypothetical protein [bacterium]HPQ19985.1 hypothetical protein [bacterium]